MERSEALTGSARGMHEGLVGKCNDTNEFNKGLDAESSGRHG